MIMERTESASTLDAQNAYVLGYIPNALWSYAGSLSDMTSYTSVPYSSAAVELADYVSAFAGTSADLDRELEAAAIERLLASDD